jgi:hypothetical protein
VQGIVKQNLSKSVNMPVLDKAQLVRVSLPRTPFPILAWSRYRTKAASRLTRPISIGCGIAVGCLGTGISVPTLGAYLTTDRSAAILYFKLATSEE